MQIFEVDKPTTQPIPFCSHSFRSTSNIFFRTSTSADKNVPTSKNITIKKVLTIQYSLIVFDFSSNIEAHTTISRKTGQAFRKGVRI